MHLGQAISTCFRKYVDFTGHASRSEYWWFALFNVLVSIAANIVDASITFTLDTEVSLVSALWALGVLLPGLAVSVRRLRDAGYGWGWIFIPLVPFAGIVVFIVLVCQPTKYRVAPYNPALYSMAR